LPGLQDLVKCCNNEVLGIAGGKLRVQYFFNFLLEFVNCHLVFFEPGQTVDVDLGDYGAGEWQGESPKVTVLLAKPGLNCSKDNRTDPKNPCEDGHKDTHDNSFAIFIDWSEGVSEAQLERRATINQRAMLAMIHRAFCWGEVVIRRYGGGGYVRDYLFRGRDTIRVD
jgi:hypothetical protein